jgi:hypothetical protein
VFAQQVVQGEEEDEIDGVDTEYHPLAENATATARMTSMHTATPATILSTNCEAVE